MTMRAGASEQAASAAGPAADVQRTSEPPAPNATPSKRGRGRQKGLGKVPGSGRQKNTVNWSTQSTRERLLPKAAMLADRVLSGKPIKSGKTWVYPTTAEQLRAAELVLARTLPTLSAQELTGKDGAPLNPEPLVTDSRDVARAILGVLREAQTEGPDTPASRPAKPRATDEPETIEGIFRDEALAKKFGGVPLDGPAPEPTFEVGHVEHFDNAWIALEPTGRWEIYRTVGNRNIDHALTHGEAVARARAVKPPVVLR